MAISIRSLTIERASASAGTSARPSGAIPSRQRRFLLEPVLLIRPGLLFVRVRDQSQAIYQSLSGSHQPYWLAPALHPWLNTPSSMQCNHNGATFFVYCLDSSVLSSSQHSSWRRRRQLTRQSRQDLKEISSRHLILGCKKCLSSLPNARFHVWQPSKCSG